MHIGPADMGKVLINKLIRPIHCMFGVSLCGCLTCQSHLDWFSNSNTVIKCPLVAPSIGKVLTILIIENIKSTPYMA